MAEYYVWVEGIANVEAGKEKQQVRVKIQTTDVDTAKRLVLEQVKQSMTEVRIVNIERTA
jgi:hypothetical protein